MDIFFVKENKRTRTVFPVDTSYSFPWASAYLSHVDTYYLFPLAWTLWMSSKASERTRSWRQVIEGQLGSNKLA